MKPDLETVSSMTVLADRRVLSAVVVALRLGPHGFSSVPPPDLTNYKVVTGNLHLFFFVPELDVQPPRFCRVCVMMKDENFNTQRKMKSARITTVPHKEDEDLHSHFCQPGSNDSSKESLTFSPFCDSISISAYWVAP